MARRNSPDQLELFDRTGASAAAGRRSPGRAASRGGKARGTPVKRATPRRDEGGLRAELNGLFRGRLADLVLTRNHHSIVSAKPLPSNRQKIALRLDECFLSAPPTTLAAVATWVLSGPGKSSAALARIRDHYAVAADHAKRAKKPRRSAPRRTAGEMVDLARVYDRLNRRYFDGALTATITWGRSAGAAASAGGRAPARRRYGRTRTIQLGSYSFEQKLIRIHACLDHESVPAYVVEAVVYHEMVHAALPPPERGAARRILHPPEFRDLERRYQRHREAEAWIGANFGKLLRRC